MALMNVLAILIGLLTLVVTLVGLVPLLGWLEWFALVLGLVGAAVGAMSRSRGGMVLNIVLIVVAVFRLFMGGGFI